MHRPSLPKWADAMEAYREYQRQQREMDELLHPPKQRKAAVRREGASRLSQDQIDLAQAYHKRKLNDPNEPPHRWRTQRTAAKLITVEFLKLPEESWQTVEDQVVIPVLERCGLRKSKK